MRMIATILLAAIVLSCNDFHAKKNNAVADSPVDSANNHASEDAEIRQAVHNAYAALTYRHGVNFNIDSAKLPFTGQATFTHFDDNDSAVVENLDQFLGGFKRLMISNGIESFDAESVHTKTNEFGRIASNFGSYKLYVNTKDTVAERGIISLQLLKTKEGWRVSNWVWHKQGNGVMLSPEYLQQSE